MKFDNILINGPKEAKNILLLAHGAGAPMDSLFMNTISDGLNKNGIITIRFEFPYMAKKRLGKNTFPDKFDVMCEFYNKIYFYIKKTNPNKNIWLGGKSMGGRVSAVISSSLDIKGVIVFGYPFHPINKFDKLRLESLQLSGPPILIIQGTRDKFGTIDEVKKYKIHKNNTIYWIKDGDHSYNTLKKSILSSEEAIIQAYNQASLFIKETKSILF
tara:strand:+ start:7027 stop:7671 length:645 start_codon:yes stop_codon:yes gene_type:complete